MSFLNSRICFSFIPSYRLRVESMLLKAEFEADMSFLEPSIAAMISAGEGKKENNFSISRLPHSVSSYVFVFECITLEKELQNTNAKKGCVNKGLNFILILKN